MDQMVRELEEAGHYWSSDKNWPMCLVKGYVYCRAVLLIKFLVHFKFNETFDYSAGA